MKVVHLGIGIIPVPPPDNIAAGGEEYIYVLSRYQSRLGSQVHVIDIKGGAQQREKRQQSQARFHELWRPSLPYKYNHRFLQRPFYYLRDTSQSLLFALLSAFPLYRLLARGKIDIIHIHNANVALAVMIVNKMGGNRAVTVYTPFSAYGLKRFSWFKRLIYFAEAPTLRWVDHIIASNHWLKEWLVSEFHLDPVKMTLIPGGTDTDEVRKFISQEAEAGHQSNIVFCSGVICQRKNQLTAVKAIAKVVAAHPEVKLVFAGPIDQADYFNSIQRFIAENNLSRWVEFKGEVSKQELYRLYSEAALYLFPTTAEVDPATLREALVFGLPVVASKIEPIADVTSQEEGCAILVDPYDADGMAQAVCRLLEDDLLRQSMSEKARKLGQALSYENIAARILALYEKLIQEKKAALSQSQGEK